MKKLFSEIPHILGERLELRRLETSDAAGLRELTESEEVYRFLPTFLYEKSIDDAEEAISRMYDVDLEKSLILGVFINGEFCGLAEFYGWRAPLLKISVGYRLLPRFWGKGIATETLGLMVGFLFDETDVKTITASVISENNGSANVLKKNGFHCVARSVPEDWGYTHLTKADKWILTSAGYRRECRFYPQKNGK